MNIQQLEALWGQHSDRLIPYLKGTIVISNSDRNLTQVSIAYVIEDGYHMVIAITTEQNSEIMMGYPLFHLDDADDDNNSNSNTKIIPVNAHQTAPFDFKCDLCSCDLPLYGFMCRQCNFDSCPDCYPKCKHSCDLSHEMFKYIGYFGWNTYESKNIISEITVSL